MTADRCAPSPERRTWRRFQALAFGAAVVIAWWFWASSASADEAETGTAAPAEVAEMPAAPAVPVGPDAASTGDAATSGASVGAGDAVEAGDAGETEAQAQQDLVAQGPLTSTVHAAAPTLAPAAHPVTRTVDELGAPLDSAVHPVVATVIDPIVPMAQPVTTTVDQAVAPVVAPVAPMVMPVVAPLRESVLTPAVRDLEKLSTASPATNGAPMAAEAAHAGRAASAPSSSDLVAGPAAAAAPDDARLGGFRRARSHSSLTASGSTRGSAAGETLPVLQGTGPALPGGLPAAPSSDGRPHGVPAPRGSSGSSSSGGSDSPDRTHRAGPSVTTAAPAASPAAAEPLWAGIVGPSKDLGSRPAFTPD